jgi:four helix bundle protein
MTSEMPKFERWVAEPSNATPERLVWRLRAYRLALYALDLAWADAVALARIAITRRVASQLYDAVGSIGANISEGYSRSSGRDRARFYEYALGSARESVTWYRAAAPVLGAEVTQHRQDVLLQIILLILASLPGERNRRIEPSE